MSDYWIDAFNRANEAAIQAGSKAGQTLVLINGGAAIALLAFAGNLAGGGRIKHVEPFGDVLGSFAWGVALGTVSLCLGYLINLWHAAGAQSRISKPNEPISESYLWDSRGLSFLAILAGLSSLVFFVCGIFAARSALKVMALLSA